MARLSLYSRWLQSAKRQLPSIDTFLPSIAMLANSPIKDMHHSPIVSSTSAGLEELEANVLAALNRATLAARDADLAR